MKKIPVKMIRLMVTRTLEPAFEVYEYGRDLLFFERGKIVYMISLDGRPSLPKLERTTWRSIESIRQFVETHFNYTEEKIEKEHLEILAKALL